MKHERESHVRILKAFLSDCKRSDREISSHIGVSQPTVTRVRQKFLSNGIIKSYEIIPGLAKLGFEILAFSIMESTEEDLVKEDNEVVYAINLDPSMMYAVSVHKKYADYSNFCRRYKVHSGLSHLVPTSIVPVKLFSFRDIPL